MNISPEIMKYAEKLGLEAVATGGGCDYIGLTMVLVSADGFDSPDSLDEPAVLCFPFGEDNPSGLPFPTAMEAMEAMEAIREGKLLIEKHSRCHGRAVGD